MDIEAIQAKTNDEQLTFGYVLKKACESTKKIERLAILKDYYTYMANSKNKGTQKVQSIFCEKCHDPLDENGVCQNCESCK